MKRTLSLSADQTALVKKLLGLIVSADATKDRRGRGAMLADKIWREFGRGYLEDDTYDQLKKWCEMERRMPLVEGYFRQISRILFGESLKR